MKEFSFELPDEDSLIIVDCKIRHHNFALAVDTGASHTIVDLTALLLIGFTMNDMIRQTQLETGNGPVDAYVFQVAKFGSLGKVKENFENLCLRLFLQCRLFRI
jgi:predicted aspartyl protease